MHAQEMVSPTTTKHPLQKYPRNTISMRAAGMSRQPRDLCFAPGTTRPLSRHGYCRTGAMPGQEVPVPGCSVGSAPQDSIACLQGGKPPPHTMTGTSQGGGSKGRRRLTSK